VRTNRIQKFILAAFVCGASLANASAQTFSSTDLQSRLVTRRAVDAVIWGVPLVSVDMMRQAYFRDAKANYNDVVWWPNGATWKNQSTATNSLVRYIYIFYDGPVVIELPPRRS
jgi:hypothetical protein